MIEALRDGGVLLDLGSGTVFSLNATAVLVWNRALLGHSSAAIASELAAAFQVPANLAQEDVEAALNLSHDFPPAPVHDSFRYEASDEGFLLTSRGVPVLEVSSTRRSLRQLAASTPQDIDRYLRALAPKLAALLGVSILHASAVIAGDEVIAFLGESGAGKTTTARAFAALGCPLIAEDKMVVRRENLGVATVARGEEGITAWIGETTRLLGTGTHEWCEAGALGEIATGEALPVGKVAFVDPGRRRGRDIQFTRISEADAAAQIFRHSFHGSSAESDWRRQLAVAATLARTTPSFEATMPSGLEQLAAAARRYTETTAS